MKTGNLLTILKDFIWQDRVITNDFYRGIITEEELRHKTRVNLKETFLKIKGL